MADESTRFAGRVAVVTGAASGIGKATAARLAREGARVAAVDRHLVGAEETAAAIRAAGGTARAHACDLAGRSKSANAGAAYTASKAGLLGLTRHLAFDYGPRGVRVNAICPGGVDTPLLRAGRAGETPEERSVRLAAYGHFMPIKRISTPDEQAAAIAFLASDEASYVNGVSLDVNGGLFMA